MKLCTKEGCSLKHRAKGLCQKHYHKLKSNEWHYANKTHRAEMGKAYRKRFKDTDIEGYQKYSKERNFRITNRFSKAKQEAKKRKINWNLSYDEFKSLAEKECYYCSGFFSKPTGGSGLDRINNDKSIGYVNQNVLPCCGSCNVTRNTNYTVEETKAMVQLVIQMRGPKLKAA